MLRLENFQSLVTSKLRGRNLQFFTQARCGNLVPDTSKTSLESHKFKTLNRYQLALRYNYQLTYIYRELALAYLYRADPIIISLAHIKMNKKKCAKLVKASQRDHVKATILWSFYNPVKASSNVTLLNTLLPAQDNAKNFLAHMLYDAYGFEKESIPAKYRSEHVMGIMMGIRESEDFTRFPIVADALQDSGYENMAVLNHMRTFPLITLGSGLFRMVGIT